MLGEPHVLHVLLGSALLVEPMSSPPPPGMFWTGWGAAVLAIQAFVHGTLPRVGLSDGRTLA